MKRAGKYVSAFLACSVVLLLAGCDAGPAKKVEILSASGPGKTPIRVAASGEAYVHFMKVAEAYSRKHVVQFDVALTQGKNIPGLIEKKAVDIGVSARRFTPDELGPRISYIPYAYDGAVFLVSPDAKVRSLTLSQVRQIIRGEVANWKEVGGADRPIRVIGCPQGSAARMSMAAALFDRDFPDSKATQVMETSENVFHALRTMKSYIAYAPISRITVENFPSIPLTIDGMPPLVNNVPVAKYPARIEYSLLIPKDPPPAVTEFANFLQSVEAVHLLASYALVPAAGKFSLSSCHCRATEGTFSPSRGSALTGTFTIAVVPELGAIQQENRYVGISRVIADEMGVRTQLKHLETYERVISEFADGRIDAAFVGSLVYGQLHERLGVVPLARPESGKTSRYQGVLIVAAAGGIRDLHGLRGKSIAYVPNTSAGELYYRMLLRRMGPGGGREFFSRVVPVSTHADAIQMVVEGKVDSAAVKDLVLKRMVDERGKSGFPGIKERVRILDASPFFPENALVVSTSIDPKQSAKLKDILLSMDKREEGRTALRVLGADRFIPTTHADYEKMYQMAQEAGYSFRNK